jgi:transcriptional regulator with XRE-family HTH domain
MERQNLEGGVLRELREERGLTLRDVVEKLNGDADTLSPQALSRIELGQRVPSSRTLVALAKALEVEFHVSSMGIEIVEGSDDAVAG